MKKILLQVILIMTFTSLSAQVKFEKGYFIDQSNKKVECFIKNDDWISPPKEITYRISDSTAVQVRDFTTMISFQIYNTSQYYIKSQIEIDSKTDTKSFNPTLENTVVKVIVEGKASLYSLSDLFFYQVNDDKIKQLVYKRYVSANSQLMEENTFRRELFENLKCESNTNEIRKLAYKEEKLIAFFKNYNSCQNSEYTTYADAKKKSLLKLNLLVGATYNKANFKMSDLYSQVPSVGISNEIKNIKSNYETGYLVGFEGEFILPYQNYSWSIFTAPTYQKVVFKTSKDNANPITNDKGFGTLFLDYNYTYFDIPLGIRHYFNLNKKSKLYLDAALSMILLTETNEIRKFVDKQGISEILPNNFDPKTSATAARIGFGFSYDSKYSLALNYLPKRTLSNSQVDGFSLIASYKLF